VPQGPTRSEGPSRGAGDGSVRPQPRRRSHCNGVFVVVRYRAAQTIAPTFGGGDGFVRRAAQWIPVLGWTAMLGGGETGETGDSMGRLAEKWAASVGEPYVSI
jgi:hypothetical protein